MWKKALWNVLYPKHWLVTLFPLMFGSNRLMRQYDEDMKMLQWMILSISLNSLLPEGEEEVGLISAYKHPTRVQRHREMHQMGLLSNLRGHTHTHTHTHTQRAWALPWVECQARRLGLCPQIMPSLVTLPAIKTTAASASTDAHPSLWSE